MFLENNVYETSFEDFMQGCVLQILIFSVKGLQKWPSSSLFWGEIFIGKSLKRSALKILKSLEKSWKIVYDYTYYVFYSIFFYNLNLQLGM